MLQLDNSLYAELNHLWQTNDIPDKIARLHNQSRNFGARWHQVAHPLIDTQEKPSINDEVLPSCGITSSQTKNAITPLPNVTASSHFCPLLA